MEVLNPHVNRLCISSAEGDYIINYSVIIYIKACNAQAEIHTTTKQIPFISSKPLAYYLEMLPEDIFLQIHRSYIINLEFLTFKTRGKTPDVTLLNKIVLPVSAKYRGALEEYLDKLK